MMARPSTRTSVRPRATARSFPKHSTINKDEGMLHPKLTPPYSSTEDFGLYPYPHLLAPPQMPGQPPQNFIGASGAPHELMVQGDGSYAYPQPYPGSQYIPRHYYPPTPSVTIQTEVVDTFTASAPSTPVQQQDLLPSDNEAAQPTLSPKAHTPRPPNAWILYRSDMLRTIASGGEIPGLEAVMSELGVAAPTTSESSGEDKGASTDGGKPKKPKKGKKGAKEPSEGLLSLGRGKTGRGLPQADISKMISMLWKRESPEVRGEYEQRSETKKKEHAALYPDYKFQPLRKADKIRKREEKEREKEAARREKELLKSGGGRRKTRTRNRLSPTSPYSVLNADATRMSRTLSYPGPGDHDFSHDNGHMGTPRERQDRFRSYPFPMPESSLPALRSDEMALPYKAAFASYPPPPHLMPFAPLARQEQPPSTPPQSQPLTAPSSQPDSAISSPRREPQSRQDANGQANTPSVSDTGDVHEMAALWSKMNSDSASIPPNGQAYPGDDQQQFQYQAVQELVGEDGATLPLSDYSTFAEVELRHIQPDQYDGGWVQYAESYPQADYAFAPYMEDANGMLYATEQAFVPVEKVAWHDTMFDFTNATDSPIVIGDPSAVPLVPMEAVVVEDNGPFLFEQAVFSPDPEAFRPIEPDGSNQATANANEASEAYGLSRHVSSTEFPTHSNLASSTSWNDRAASFAFANSLAAPLHAFTAEDVIGWDDASSPAQSRQASRSGDEIPSSTSMPSSFSASTPDGRAGEHANETKKE